MSKAAQTATDSNRDGNWLIRSATIEDVEAIFSIESEAFTTPWPRSAFEGEIKGRSWSRVSVAEVDGEVVGFMVYWVVATELHLLNLAVSEQWRRQGIGRGLTDHLMADAKKNKRTGVLLELRVSNAPAFNLYQSLGFKELAIRPGYYVDNGEDAMVMSIQLDAKANKKRREP